MATKNKTLDDVLRTVQAEEKLLSANEYIEEQGRDGAKESPCFSCPGATGGCINPICSIGCELKASPRADECEWFLNGLAAQDSKAKRFRRKFPETHPAYSVAESDHIANTGLLYPPLRATKPEDFLEQYIDPQDNVNIVIDRRAGEKVGSYVDGPQNIRCWKINARQPFRCLEPVARHWLRERVQKLPRERVLRRNAPIERQRGYILPTHLAPAGGEIKGLRRYLNYYYILIDLTFSDDEIVAAIHDFHTRLKKKSVINPIKPNAAPVDIDAEIFEGARSVKKFPELASKLGKKTSTVAKAAERANELSNPYRPFKKRDRRKEYQGGPEAKSQLHRKITADLKDAIQQKVEASSPPVLRGYIREIIERMMPDGEKKAAILDALGKAPVNEIKETIRQEIGGIDHVVLRETIQKSIEEKMYEVSRKFMKPSPKLERGIERDLSEMAKSDTENAFLHSDQLPILYTPDTARQLPDDEVLGVGLHRAKATWGHGVHTQITPPVDYDVSDAIEIAIHEYDINIPYGIDINTPIRSNRLLAGWCRHPAHGFDPSRQGTFSWDVDSELQERARGETEASGRPSRATMKAIKNEGRALSWNRYAAEYILYGIQTSYVYEKDKRGDVNLVPMRDIVSRPTTPRAFKPMPHLDTSLTAVYTGLSENTEQGTYEDKVKKHTDAIERAQEEFPL